MAPGIGMIESSQEGVACGLLLTALGAAFLGEGDGHGLPSAVAFVSQLADVLADRASGRTAMEWHGQ
jgi:hypothetical protein